MGATATTTSPPLPHAPTAMLGAAVPAAATTAAAAAAGATPQTGGGGVPTDPPPARRPTERRRRGYRHHPWPRRAVAAAASRRRRRPRPWPLSSGPTDPWWRVLRRRHAGARPPTPDRRSTHHGVRRVRVAKAPDKAPLDLPHFKVNSHKSTAFSVHFLLKTRSRKYPELVHSMRSSPTTRPRDRPPSRAAARFRQASHRQQAPPPPPPAPPPSPPRLPPPATSRRIAWHLQARRAQYSCRL